MGIGSERQVEILGEKGREMGGGSMTLLLCMVLQRSVVKICPRLVPGAVGGITGSGIWGLWIVVTSVDHLFSQIKDDVRAHPMFYSQIYVPHPLMVPGGRFIEYYYW